MRLFLAFALALITAAMCSAKDLPKTDPKENFAARGLTIAISPDNEWIIFVVGVGPNPYEPSQYRICTFKNSLDNYGVYIIILERIVRDRVLEEVMVYGESHEHCTNNDPQLRKTNAPMINTLFRLHSIMLKETHTLYILDK